MSKETKLKECFKILESSRDSDYIGEPVSQLMHALQSAHFAVQAKAEDEVVLACLFHDIGHLCAPEDAQKMGELGVLSHELIGAAYLRTVGFSERLAVLVQSHVDAKRYLSSVNPRYLKHLSQASLQTLEYQGGAMKKDELKRFEEQTDFKNMILVRKCDEAAKRTDLKMAPLQSYYELALSCLN